MVSVEDYNYSTECSQSYTSNLHLPVMNESVPFVMPLDSTLQQAFHSYLITIEYNTVSIFIQSNSLVKVFDSHTRDSFGMPHAYGTCVLLELDSVNNLIEYFKFLYRPDFIYEIKDVRIHNACSALTENVDTNVIYNASSKSHESSHRPVAQEKLNDNSIFNTRRYFIFIYGICFFTISSCNYWSCQTENAIVEHAIELFDENLNESILSINLPESIRIP